MQRKRCWFRYDRTCKQNTSSSAPRLVPKFGNFFSLPALRGAAVCTWRDSQSKSILMDCGSYAIRDDGCGDGDSWRRTPGGRESL
jgi:hypothetical protein